MINSPIAFFVLIGLYPVIFLTSKNWFVYEANQLLFLLVVPLATGLFGFMGIYLADLIIPRTFLKKIITEENRRFLICLAGFCLFYFIFGATIAASKIALTGFIVAVLLFSLVARKTGMRVVNLVFVIMTIFATLDLVYSINTRSIKNDLVLPTLNEENDSKVKFKSAPNIYLIHLESYHSPEAMKQIYNFDNSEFQENLENRGFFVTQNNFSNYNNTLSSIGAMFLQQHHYYTVSSGIQDAIGIRDVIGGRKYNPTLAILKNNGYKISYIQPSTYSFWAGSILDFYYPKSELHDSLLIFQNPRVTKLRSILFGVKEPAPNTRELEYANEEDFYNVLRSKLNEAEADKPTFYFIKEPLAVNHTPSKGYTWKKSEDGWVDQYVQSVKDSNPMVLTTVDQIIKNDPDGVIILYGDHGAWRYKNVWIDDEGTGKPIEELIADRRGLTMEQLALDVFGVYTAVRYPGGDSSLLDGKSYVNLFRELFSDLAGEESALSELEDASFLKYGGVVYKIVKDGRALDKAEIVEIVCKGWSC